ncbi:hypothetical protein SS50377_21098 [Spironucleus salmonicida]|uniref:Uncharacterized protein n=1 Tax=Spironucleus salmonicida TaxID=348837 RepID=V6LH47_9EUKA|nr:hypothetical protein SS50377_21098 [Spironucleus salmonicida]|eukprot:EST43880.1 Hypothetical protein SS50377_16180 [Spironucleus salmonicida]
MEKISYVPTPREKLPAGPRHVHSLKQLYQAPEQVFYRNPELKVKDDISFTAIIPQNRDVFIPKCAQQQFSFAPLQQKSNDVLRQPSLFNKDEIKPHQRKNLQNLYIHNELNLPKADFLTPIQRENQHSNMYRKSLDENRQEVLVTPQLRQHNSNWSHKDALQPFDRVFGHQGHQHFDHTSQNLDKSGGKFY